MVSFLYGQSVDDDMEIVFHFEIFIDIPIDDESADKLYEYIQEKVDDKVKIKSSDDYYKLSRNEFDHMIEYLAEKDGYIMGSFKKIELEYNIFVFLSRSFNLPRISDL